MRYAISSQPPGLAILPAVYLAASLAVIAGFFYFEKIVGLRPCELCLTERWPWYGLPVVSAILMAAGHRWLLIGVPLCILILAASFGLGIYHVAVEQHWIAGPSACTGRSLLGQSAADAVKALMATPVVRCDEVRWRLIGVSLAGWNAIISLLLAVTGAAIWIKSVPRTNRITP